MFNLTKHANKRLNQRGITGKTFKLFMQYADREVNVGSGDFALSVSNSQSLALKRAGIQSDVLLSLESILFVYLTKDNCLLMILKYFLWF